MEGKAFEAVWAIDEISEGKFPIKDIESFLGHLMDHISDREITVQVKIDEVVCEMDLRGWASSDDRMNVLNSWIEIYRIILETNCIKLEPGLINRHGEMGSVQVFMISTKSH